MQEFGIYLSAGTIVALGIALFNIARKFSRLEADVEVLGNSRKEDKTDRDVMEARIENISRDLTTAERDGIIRIDTLRLETGEMGAALRQKVHDVEITSRDRIDAMASDIRESIEKLGDRLESRIERALQSRRES